MEGALTQSNNSFGFDLLKELCKEEGGKNVFVSPLSIVTVLNMIVSGCAEKSETHKCIKGVLHQEKIRDEEMEQHFEKLLLNTTAEKDTGVECNMAQSAWVKEGVDGKSAIREEYKDMVKRCFQADAFPLVSAQEINRWCAEKTNDMIGHILDAIPQEAKLVLVNAVYFKGSWKFSFDREQTKEEDFASSRGKLRVPMMFQKRDDFMYYEKEGLFEMIQLDYGAGDKYCATIILPHPVLNAYEFLEKMTATDWDSWRSELRRREGSLRIPRMHVRYGVKSMRTPLSNMGMGMAFTANNAYEKIGEDISLSDVLHTAVIQLDEEGTTAAAATAATLLRAMVTTVRPFDMKVDRPFLLFISTKGAGDLVFAGCIDKPM